MGLLAVHFFPQGSRTNPKVLAPMTYRQGTAVLVPDSRNIVNKLWVKGEKAISELYTQNISVIGQAVQMDYSPRSPITVTIGGLVKTLGIQNITDPGTVDFLINANEKLLIPDLCTSGTGTISYKYEYPIRILLEEPISQGQHGIFEDSISVSTDDKDLALELGYKHLYKYSQPVVSGTIGPLEGQYRPGELIKVELPDLNVNQYLKIQEAAYISVPNEPVEINLTLDTPERDMSNILKDMAARLAKLEKTTYQDDDGPVEKYIAKEEIYNWSEVAGKTDPIQDASWLFWAEDVSESSHLLLLPSDALYPGATLYP